VEGEAVTEDTPEITASLHRRLAVDLFNRSWTLLEMPNRTRADDDALIHTVHASAYHWRLIGNAANIARGENQCARVYSGLGRGEPALHHALRCLELVEAGGEGLEDWDLASALEVTARAHLALGDTDTARNYATRAARAVEEISDSDDRAWIAHQLSELNL